MPRDKPDRKADQRRHPDDLQLPTMALAMPPPASPAGSGSLVKKFQLSEVAPL